MQPVEIKLDECDCEAIFVRVLNSITLCCYYRPNHGAQISAFTAAMGQVAKRFPTDHFILVGDMNFPGFNWKNNSVKRDTQYKTLHMEFLSFLCEFNFTQIIDTPTHNKGNTLDLVCTTNPSSVSAEVIYPGISDHFLISVSIRHCLSRTMQKTRTKK